MVVIWFTGVVLIFKSWKTEPYKLELSPEPTLGSLIKVKVGNLENVEDIASDIDDFLERE